MPLNCLNLWASLNFMNFCKFYWSLYHSGNTHSDFLFAILKRKKKHNSKNMSRALPSSLSVNSISMSGRRKKTRKIVNNLWCWNRARKTEKERSATDLSSMRITSRTSQVWVCIFFSHANLLRKEIRKCGLKIACFVIREVFPINHLQLITFFHLDDH